jgi:hypothetical protein
LLADGAGGDDADGKNEAGKLETQSAVGSRGSTVSVGSHFFTSAELRFERSVPNAERRTPNAERRTPNAERRTPNAERRTPNAERRTPNAERRRKIPRNPQLTATSRHGNFTAIRSPALHGHHAT